MAPNIKHFMDEADIGSGERNAEQEDLERAQQSINALPSNPSSGHRQHSYPEEQETDETGRILQSGTHLARILAVKQPDGMYEAQVYVRLTREPEIAETYIPAGMFPSEKEAWTGAEQRAQRAFREHEF